MKGTTEIKEDLKTGAVIIMVIALDPEDKPL
jgi:hypothetical protein